MKKMTKIAMASVACMALVGCSDSYDDNKNVENVAPVTAPTSELKVLNRNAKFLTDTDSMSLYIFDKDMLNTSNCDAECQQIWPLFEGADTGSEDIKVLEGTDHLTYRKHPLYYFVNDKALGDILGNNVKNVWHLVYAPAGSTDTQTTLSETNMKQTYLTDKEGRALYTFDKDSENVSNCYDTTPTSGEGCETIWPVFYSADLGALPSGTTAADFAVINRDAAKAKEGEPTQQVSYKGKPLYYFTPDNKEAGSVKGDWVKGVWHLIELDAVKVGTTPPTTEEPTTGADVEAGKSKYASCASCHGPDGLNRAFGISIKIGELDDPAKVEPLLNYMKNDGQGKNSTMVNIAKGLSDKEIKDLSAYIGTL